VPPLLFCIIIIIQLSRRRIWPQRVVHVYKASSSGRKDDVCCYIQVQEKKREKKLIIKRPSFSRPILLHLLQQHVSAVKKHMEGGARVKKPALEPAGRFPQPDLPGPNVSGCDSYTCSATQNASNWLEFEFSTPAAHGATQINHFLRDFLLNV
jgi:hypothetical protein